MAPEVVVAAVMLASLTLYAVFGGADFGGGIWEFNTAFRASENERRLIASAMGPVWEANHVWLILVLVLLANGFPLAFAGLSRALWVPMWIALVGIVFRGAAFAFQSYSVGAARQQRTWHSVFALASALTPFFMGSTVGAIASGQLAVDADGSFSGDHIVGWVSPLAIFTAVFSVGMCAYLAAFFLTRESQQRNNRDLVDLWRRRSLVTGIFMGMLAVAGLVLIAFDAPRLWSGFEDTGWSLVLTSLVSGFLSLAAMWKGRFNLAVAGAVLTVAAMVLAWGVAQFPAIIPPAVTMSEAKAPDPVLRAMVASISVGTLLLAPSLAWLFYIFKRAER